MDGQSGESNPTNRRGLIRTKLTQARLLAESFHNYTLGHPSIRKLAAIAWLPLAMAGVGLAKWDEYGLALGCFLLTAFILFLKAYHWKGIEERPVASSILRFLFVVVTAAMIIGSYPVTLAKKGNKPWSDTYYSWTHEVYLSPEELKRGKAFAQPEIPYFGYDKTPQPKKSWIED
jgi:hypothetical protein